MMPNPWFILGGVLLVIALCAGSAYEGHSYGVDSQKVADQKEFDRIEAERTEQKAEANKLYQDAQNGIIALQQERDTLKTTIEEQDAKNRKATLILNADLATAKLRFRTAQSAGNRSDGSGTVPGTSDTASTGTAVVVQLPDALAGSLRRLAFDADRLKDEYAKCFAYATKVR